MSKVLKRAATKGPSELHLGTLTASERREFGVVFTPDALAGFVLDKAGYDPKAGIDRAALLDPACGAGVFLIAALTRLARRIERLEGPLHHPEARDAFLNAAERCLFGVDVDPRACELSRALLREAAELEVRGPVPAGFMVSNIVAADYLLGGVGAEEGRALPKRFDFIVGNPPYVAATKIKPEYKEALRSSYQTAVGRLDLYGLFFERAIEQLRDGGRLAFITPDKYLLSQTSKSLRDFILEHTCITTIARFGSHKVFSDAATVPCVTVLERGGNLDQIELLTCSFDTQQASGVEVSARTFTPRSTLAGGPWHLVDQDDLEFARSLQWRHPTLASQTVRVSAGPATGRDGVFLVPADRVDLIEPELMREVVRGRDVQAFNLSPSGAKILFPYRSEPGSPPRLVALDDFPEAAKYLAEHRASLEARHCVRQWGKAWYDWHDQPQCDLARQPKILVPDLALTNRFAVDGGEFLPLHSVYYLLPKDEGALYYLLGVLNSSVAEYLVRLLSPRMKDGFSRYRQQFLAEIPIPQASPAMHREVSEAARRGDQAEVNQLVAQLFGLSREAVERISLFLGDGGKRG